MRVAGLFAGIGGIELGLQLAGHHVEMMCEIDKDAVTVLRSRFPDVRIHRDIRTLRALPSVDVIAAGFPCQDLSQAGTTTGLAGENSGLVLCMLDLIESKKPSRRPPWLLLENVPFMLQLSGGRAIRALTRRLGAMGYTWAYRVVDAHSFGLPQRRRRVILVASRVGNPGSIVLADDAGVPIRQLSDRRACGFYWTEGNRGLGWAVDSIPPLKGSSGLGIPSPPAIWMPDGRIVVPDIRDAERLQGFAPDWTGAANDVHRSRGARWRLVGNAVSVPVAEWVGQRLNEPAMFELQRTEGIADGKSWPSAAWGEGDAAYRFEASAWPQSRMPTGLEVFLRYELKSLSARASAGFLRRLEASRLSVPQAFLTDLRKHVATAALRRPVHFDDRPMKASVSHRTVVAKSA